MGDGHTLQVGLGHFRGGSIFPGTRADVGWLAVELAQYCVSAKVQSRSSKLSVWISPYRACALLAGSISCSRRVVRCRRLKMFGGARNRTSMVGVNRLARWALGRGDDIARRGQAPMDARASPLGILTRSPCGSYRMAWSVIWLRLCSPVGGDRLPGRHIVSCLNVLLCDRRDDVPSTGFRMEGPQWGIQYSFGASGNVEIDRERYEIWP